MPECPVCLQDIHADDIAFQHHANSHFADLPTRPALPGPPPLRDAGGAWQRPEGGTGADEASLPEQCMLCDYPFESLTARQRQDHVNACLDSQGPETTLTAEAEGEMEVMADMAASEQPDVRMPRNREPDNWEGPVAPGGWSDWVSRKGNFGDKWWDPIDGSTDEIDIPANISPGAVYALQHFLQAASRITTLKARLSTDTLHIRHSVRFDLGWGCGYRNASMLISALMLHSPAYRAVFDSSTNGADPGIRRVQGWIEEAWAAGFDPDGRKQLKGKVLGTRKWIGTSELYAMFSHKGIPCRLVDIPKPPATSGANGKPRLQAHQHLIAWVKRYFDEDEDEASSPPSYDQVAANTFNVHMGNGQDHANRENSVRQTRKLPLILQHAGHSRTIVGYEETSTGTNLLLFDPGKWLAKDMRSVGLQHVRQTRKATPVPPPPRRSSHSSSHESLRFSRPYTNGASEPIMFPEETPQPEVLDDEEVTSGGWVRKRVTQVKKRSRDKESDEVEVPKRQRLSKMLSDFRVSEEMLSKHKEYQVLWFPGGPMLSMEERAARKEPTSELLRG